MGKKTKKLGDRSRLKKRGGLTGVIREVYGKTHLQMEEQEVREKEKEKIERKLIQIKKFLGMRNLKGKVMS